MKAELIIHNKAIDEHGNTVEIKLWAVEKSSDKPHGYKYSLVYIANAKRVIGYDNAEQKGDHRHCRRQDGAICLYRHRPIDKGFLRRYSFIQ